MTPNVQERQRTQITCVAHEHAPRPHGHARHFPLMYSDCTSHFLILLRNNVYILSWLPKQRTPWLVIVFPNVSSCQPPGLSLIREARRSRHGITTAEVSRRSVAGSKACGRSPASTGDGNYHNGVNRPKLQLSTAGDWYPH